ncbi:methyltransferase family protein [Orrella daihaiensis]|uniref:methyltransferase family protein n=1 Tax=Orrella daihaiensis TaxID=2782176 RepID=UPI001FB312AC|nr:isoprenylcysteine carboxylmethyltransferase family protein [Orrella daihaiensis]
MSYGLVFAQFGLLAALVWQAYQAWPNLTFGVTGSTLFAVSIALGIWTLTVNRPGNFNVIPEPREGGQLVTQGPYQWIRHPMYSSLMLFAAGCATVIDGWWAWYSCGALVLVLWFKSEVEEHLLIKQFRQYEAYRQRSKRFVPMLW